MHIFSLLFIVLFTLILISLEFVPSVSSEIKAFLILIFGLFVIHFFNEIKVIRKLIVEALKNRKNQQKGIKNFGYVSSLTGELQELVSCIERRLFSLAKDNEKLENEGLNNPINFLKKINIDEEISKEEFFKNILNLLSTFFNKNALVMFYFDKKTSETFCCCSISSNRHLAQFIKQIFLNNIVHDKKIKEGIITYYNVSNVLEDLSLFGYPVAYVKRISTNDDENNYLYFWVGFPENKVLMQNETNLITSIALEVGRQFSMYQKLREASASIKEKSQEAIKKSEYLEFISHDLRSPLSNLVTILKLLEVNDSEENKKEFIDIALNNCDSISLLLEDLLDFSKYKNSNLASFKEVFNVSTEINQIVLNYKLKATQKGLYLNLDDNLQDDVYINVDKRQFKKIINNILSNAIKYTKKGGVTVSLNDDQGKLLIEVKDTGIGMSKETLATLFESFKRGKNVEDIEGYGLGLFMVNIFSVLNDIKLNINSKENVGSSFSLILNIEDRKSKSVEIKKENIVVGGKNLENIYKIDKDKVKKILLLDDDEDLSKSMQKLIKLKGFDVVSFLNINDFKNFIIDNEVDLILSDYHIGEQDVNEVLDFLKINNLNIDVVIISGKMDLDKEEYAKKGVKAIFPKPFNFNDILA